MRLALLGEIAITIVFGLAAFRWSMSSDPDFHVLATIVFVFMSTVWIFSIANSRGTWKPATSTTAAFLDLSILRIARRVQACTFAIVVYVVMTVVMFRFRWVARSFGASRPPDVWTYLTSNRSLLFFGITLVILAIMVLEIRRARSELQNLTAFRQELRNLPTDRIAD